MKTLLAIDTHEKISFMLPAMWPHYEKAGVDIIGIERTNRPTTWPSNAKSIAVGKDLFQRWCEHKDPRLLCDRMLDSIDRLITDPQFDEYSDFVLSTWSVMFPKPLPQPMPHKLIMAITGTSIEGFRAPYFFHYPFWFNREMGAIIRDTGRKLLDEGHNEQGANDFLLGLIVHTAGLQWYNPPAWSANGLDTPEYFPPARTALRNGVWWLGNIKNEEQLKTLLAA